MDKEDSSDDHLCSLADMIAPASPCTLEGQILMRLPLQLTD